LINLLIYTIAYENYKFVPYINLANKKIFNIFLKGEKSGENVKVNTNSPKSTKPSNTAFQRDDDSKRYILGGINTLKLIKVK
jgi:hypothetical protein